MTNGAYGSRFHGGHRSGRDETIRDGRFLDTMDMRGHGHRFYFSSHSDRYHGHHRYYPYKRSGRGYFPGKFKKENPSTFDGDLKNPKDEEEWLLEMEKFFELHDYTENMKAIIAIFTLKGKANIWWEDVKRVRDIRTKELSWLELKRLFRKK